MEIIAMKFYHTLLCNSYLDVPQGHLWGRFAEQKLQCDQIHKNHCHEFGHTLFCCLSLTLMSAKLVPEVGLLNKSFGLSCSFKRDQSYYNHCYEFGHTLLFS
jgi:hypothetical protein